jgi:hypothetical protein
MRTRIRRHKRSRTRLPARPTVPFCPEEELWVAAGEGRVRCSGCGRLLFPRAVYDAVTQRFVGWQLPAHKLPAVGDPPVRRCTGVLAGHCPVPHLRCHQGCDYANADGDPTMVVVFE